MDYIFSSCDKFGVDVGSDVLYEAIASEVHKGKQRKGAWRELQ